MITTLFWPVDPVSRFRWVVAMLTALAAAVVVSAVLFNFVVARLERHPVERRRPSLVATGSMTLFFIGFWSLLRFRVGALAVAEPWLRVLLPGLGVAVIVSGATVNILGRIRFGANWANQATVYMTQTLVTDGVFGLIRHPLYASLVWMFLGACLEFANPVAALAVLLVFVPMMIHRARLEERLLEERFPEYAAYRQRVGMLFPRVLPRRHSNAKKVCP